jgi:hypothetical protein
MIAYATINEVKQASPETFSGTTYDLGLRAMCERASRMIDGLTGRRFWPHTETRYFAGTNSRRLFVPDLLEITSVGLSSDYGATWSTLASTDYFALGGARLEDAQTPYTCIELSPTGSYLEWYRGPRAAKVAGVWGWHSNYDEAWENSQDTVQNASGILAGATSITVSDADGLDLSGYTPRFQHGQLLLIGSEQFALGTVVAATTNTLTVVGAQHGTTAAIHAKAATISIWRPDSLVKQATIAQALRWFKRGQQAFQDTGGVAELGQITYTKRLDPEIEMMLYDAGLRRSRP